MSCSNIKYKLPKCKETKPLFDKVYLDPQTGRVYDKNNNYLGIGTYVNGILNVIQKHESKQII